jgi:glycosyltransferase involved in cell wall biosynthesis
MVDRGKPRERIHHLHHGVDWPGQPGQVDGGQLLEVVCLGRLVKMKNVASLLKAWKLVTAELEGARLRIIGDGPERKNLEKLADALSISGSVTFEGATQERKWALLEQASVLAFPSLQEGFPLVLLEAMAAGLPVVAYDLPVFRDFMNDGEHGYLVPLDDHQQMANRLLKLLQNDSLRQEISYRNAGYAQRFTWERATDQEESTLLYVLAQRRDIPARVQDA